MKRPVPEGVTAPEGGVILGWGGEFEVPESGSFNVFHAWSYDPNEPETGWLHHAVIVTHGTLLYAAPADSEVARGNRDPLMDAVFGENNCKGDKALGTECGQCERCKSYGWSKEPGRDEVIRGLVAKWRVDLPKDGQYSDYDLALSRCADELEVTLTRGKAD